MRLVKEGEQLESYGKIYGDYVILKIFSKDKILVEFVDTGYQAISHFRQVQSGCIRDDLVPTIQGVGFLGGREYNKQDQHNAYYCWVMMLRRVYDEKYHKRQPTYKKVKICNEWYNFQNFAKWFCNQEYEQGWELDKDLKNPGNKIYCKEYCTLVPKWINRLFPNPAKRKDKNLPQSVEIIYLKNGELNYKGYGSFKSGRIRGENKNTIQEAEIDALRLKIESINEELYYHKISDNLIDIIIDRLSIIKEKIKYLESKT